MTTAHAGRQSLIAAIRRDDPSLGPDQSGVATGTRSGTPGKRR
jgi:hypothetical protein